MADSDNTTTLPRVTRRRLLTGTATAAAGWQPRAFGRNETELSADPAVVVWREWQVIQEETVRLCRRQQCLERKLVDTVGFPSATIRLPDGKSMTVHSLEALHEVLHPGLGDEALCAKAEADFAAHQEWWDAADLEIGYSTALQNEREAAERSEELLKVLSETPAASLAGVAAKLLAILAEGQPSNEDAEFPWPQIRSVLTDIVRIDQQTEPN